MADTASRIADIRGRILTERKMVDGYQALRNATPNTDVKADCDKKIRESQRMISYFENSLNELMDDRASTPHQQQQVTDMKRLPPTPGSSDYGATRPSAQDQGSYTDSRHGHNHSLAYQPRKDTYSNLDLVKAETPLNPAKISRMVHQLGFKLTVEKQYKEGFDKMAKLYQADGDKKSRQDAESKRAESNQKMLLLNHALRKYKTLDVMGDMDDDDESNSDRKGMLRKPQTGALTINVVQATDLDRSSMTSRLGRLKARPESTVVIKIEDTPRARTHPSKTDKWNEEFEIHVDKANEVEVTIYDKAAGEAPVPVGLLSIRLSDIVEELRKKKAGQETAGPGWVTAARVEGGMSSAGQLYGNEMPVGQQVNQAFPTSDTGMSGQPGGLAEGISAWFAVEPEGQIELQLNFVKSNVRKRPFDAVGGGGLGRQGAVRKRKEEIHEQNGHKFILQQFYSVVLCAYCRKFLLNAAGMQCEDCRYVCHQGCFNHVVTKCISKSNSEVDKDEEKINHRIPHRFEPLSSLSPNWCCHCGLILPLSRKKARKCTECDLTAHADCTHLVPDFCGISMEVANRMLEQVRTINTTRQRQPLGKPQQPSGLDGMLSEATSNQLRIDQRPAQMPAQVRTDPQSTYRPNQEPPRQYSSSQQPIPATLPPSRSQPFPPNATRPDPRYGMPQSQSDPRISQMSRPDQQMGRPAPPPGASAATQPLFPQQQPPMQQRPQVDPRTAQYGLSQQRSQAQQQQYPDPAAAHQQQMMLQKQQQQLQYQQGMQIDPRSQQQQRRRVGLDDFNFLAVLGKGNFGKVMLAEEKTTSQLYAIKVLKKDFIIENDEVESTRSEKRVFMTSAKEKHPFLLNLHSCFQTETRIYFCMEFVPGGDLMLHIQRKQFSPRQAKFYGAEVLLALEFLHANGIIYRDLKLDNIMLTLDGHVKVADYGLCKESMWFGKTTSTFCGTPEFMAPEILLEQRYGRAVDWWAFGVLVYEMLLGQSPFKGEDEDEIFDAILEDEPLYPIHMPRDSVSILQKLLTRDPVKRLGAGENDAADIKRQAFFKDINFDDLFHKRIPPPFFPSVGSATDVSNFDSEFTGEKPNLTPVHSQLSLADQKEFADFDFVADWV